MQVRPLHNQDYVTLEASLASDEYHTGTSPEFFYSPGTVCNVYEDERGPICVVRGAKSLRLDIQYISNTDVERNRAVMLECFPALAEQAKTSGFSEIVFNTSSPLLKRFCIRQLGFQIVEGDELRRLL